MAAADFPGVGFPLRPDMVRQTPLGIVEIQVPGVGWVRAAAGADISAARRATFARVNEDGAGGWYVELEAPGP
jgi:hypothetical protein